MAKKRSASDNDRTVILIDQIEPLIHTVREQKVILDADLAELYGGRPND